MIFCARATRGRGLPSLGLLARLGVPVGGRVRKLRAVEDQSAPIPGDNERAWRDHLYGWWSLYVRSGNNPDHLLKTWRESATPNDLEFDTPYWTSFATSALAWTDLGGGMENNPERYLGRNLAGHRDSFFDKNPIEPVGDLYQCHA